MGLVFSVSAGAAYSSRRVLIVCGCFVAGIIAFSSGGCQLFARGRGAISLR